MTTGDGSLEARLAHLDSRLSALEREIRVLASGVTRAIDAAMHVKLELDDLRSRPRRRAKRPAAGEAA